MMIPVFRWNSVGTECASQSLSVPAEWIEKMFIVAIIVWAMSCCAIWGVNQPDA